MKPGINIILLVVIVIGCSARDESEIMHPTQQNLPSGDDHSVISAEEVKLQGSDTESTKLLTTLKTMEVISSVGELYGDQQEMFGLIEDAVIDSFNRVYILDSRKQNIRVFNLDGEYITELGGKGEGPGEFERARSMVNYNDKFLLVNNGYRIEVYNIENEEVEFVETLQLEKRSHSLCTIEDKLFLHNTQLMDQEEEMEKGNSVNMIHAYSLPSFEPLFSFGQSYKSKNPMVVDRLSSGNISCNETSSTVVFSFDMMPILHGYSATDGRMKWETRLDGVHFADVIETDEGGRSRLTYKVSEHNIRDQMLPAVTLKDEHEILQVQRRIFPDEGFERKSEVLTFSLNSSTGKGNFMSRDIPAILNISGNLAVSLSEDNMSFKLHKIDPNGKIKSIRDT